MSFTLREALNMYYLVLTKNRSKEEIDKIDRDLNGGSSRSGLFDELQAMNEMMAGG